MADTIPTDDVGPTRQTRARDLRGLRYGEVLLVRAADDHLTATVYNTFPLNDCPQDQWVALDTAAIAAENEALLAVLNGPRYWLMDFIVPGYDGEPEITTFGDIQMFRRATIDITERGLDGGPYSPVQVDRKALFGFDAGSTVFELVGPDGAAYVMQAWSQQVDPDLVEPHLHLLGARLAMPEGWTYRTRVLDAELLIDTTQRLATVLQDEFQNSYSKLD
jgi:hypothetical protein